MPVVPSLPRVPGLPDPLRRVDIPKDLEEVTTRGEEGDLRRAGMRRATVEKIWSAAEDLYRSGVHPALQLCVRRRGEVVINRSIGHARGNGPGDDETVGKVPATPATPFCIYSGSKAMTALVVHMLAEQGHFDIHDTVAKYIPEYAQHGKGDVTIAHVLAHRAGVAKLSKEAVSDLDRLGDREWVTHLISDVKPESKAGGRLAYHAVSGGFILGEVVHRATGRSIRDLMAEQILEPLGFRWMNFGVAPDDVPAVGHSYVTGPRLLPPLSTFVTRALGQPLDRVIEVSNDPRFLTAVVPSANTVTNADELSRFYEIFRRGGELDGVRVMKPETLATVLTETSRLEVDWSLGFPSRFSYGLMLGAQVLSLYGRDTDQAFGHLGLINIMGWADPERGVSGGLITSGKAILYPELPRFYNVMQTIASETPKI